MDGRVISLGGSSNPDLPLQQGMLETEYYECFLLP